MTLAMVLGSTDEEFEMLVRAMEEKERITTMHAVIAEMDKEQKRFDSLSAQMDSMTDQASAKFKDVSTALVKSQNTLALLMGRNIFCFNLQNNNDSCGGDKSKPVVIQQTKPAAAATTRRDSSADKTTSKKKVVKVTRVVKTKVITDTDGLDPQLKSIMESRRNNIKNYKKPSEAQTMQKDTNSSSPVRASNGNRRSEAAALTGATRTTNIDRVMPANCVNGHGGVGLDPSSKHPTDDPISDTDTATSSEPSAADLTFDFNSSDFDEEKVKERVFLKSWDPVKILDELYALRLAKETLANSSDVINMEGYLEQLPVGKQKSTLLKTWKRVYCTAKDGVMYFYKSKNKEAESSSFLTIMGGVLEELSGRMIGIDDRKGHYLMVRCPSDPEHRDWLRSLYTQLKCSPAAGYVRPGLSGSPHPSKVLVIDLGSCSVRAGILTTTPCYPQIFMPCITTVNSAGKSVFGAESYQPENRVNGLHYPVAASKKIEQYRVNVQALHALFMDICERLAVSPSQYTVMLATPHNFSTRLKQEVLNILFNKMHVLAVNMVNQSLLTPYIYNATSGIVVDIGQRTEIVAITDGYLVDGGLTRLSYGGQRITDNLNSYLMEYRLFTPSEHLIARLIKEKTCFVSEDYEDDLLECMGDSSQCQATVNLEQFHLPEGAHLKLITVDSARFKAAEGLIKSELLGVDSPTLPQLIHQIVSKCPMDLRREMWQSIYLSGGTTLLEGFQERLEAELNDITPPSVTVKVHANAHRYHAAYIGACMLATLPNFKSSCITKEEWTKLGKSAVSKWKHYFQGA